MSDAIATLSILFLGEGATPCQDAMDSNDDGQLDMSDAIMTLVVLFVGQGNIALPGIHVCGADLTEDPLNCEDYPSCP